MNAEFERFVRSALWAALDVDEARFPDRPPRAHLAELERILRPYVFAADRPPSRLLFPSYRTGQEAMVTDFRKLLDAVAVRAGWKPGEIRSKMFRHSYCAARLQTLDQGAPVSVYTVARELGHGGDSIG